MYVEFWNTKREISSEGLLKLILYLMEITVASLTHSGSSNVYQPLFADFPYYVAGKHNSSASYQELCLFNGSP